MKSRLLLVAAMAAITGIGLVLGYLQRSATPAPVATPSQSAPAPAPAPPPGISSTSTPAAEAGDLPPLQREIDRMCDRLLRNAASPAELAALKAALLAADPQDAVAAIRAFLRSGRDAAIGEEFTIAAGGILRAAPTLRLTMLDALGQISRKARSDDAAVVAREILAKKDSADEWAIALRNVAWTEPQARPFLAERMREMLRHEAWRTSPPDGMLEALDVVVFTKDASFVAELDDARTASSDLAHAADIALDRLAEAAPLDVLSFLNSHPARLADRPFLRADYFAKADLNQPAQRSQLEYYLGRSDVTLAEKTKLLGALITPASFVGDSLLTAPPVPDDGKARRVALAQVAGEWLAKDRFPQLREPLQTLQQRLGK